MGLPAIASLPTDCGTLYHEYFLKVMVLWLEQQEMFMISKLHQ